MSAESSFVPPAQAVTVQLQLTGNPKCLGLVRRVLSASIGQFRLPSGVLNDLKLAVTEACTNVIRHSFKYDFHRQFSLTLEFTSSVLRIRIIYEDRTFEPEKIPLPDLTSAPEGGLGVFIIRKIMDNVRYATNRETGEITLTMEKFIAQEPSTGGQP
ncbi:MAG TPA: ATP-binding protein [Candidatus Ozemobacteraceae bacterium]|nr:ATP-binding protein [Candidatus Ozemobacteraceae bacterium]